jgi:hypothetical protein
MKKTRGGKKNKRQKRYVSHPAFLGLHWRSGTASTAIYRHSSVSVGLTSTSAPNPLTAQ